MPHVCTDALTLRLSSVRTLIITTIHHNVITISFTIPLKAKETIYSPNASNLAAKILPAMRVSHG
jgi:hypothetical protein